MVRRINQRARHLRRSPHARGDGPEILYQRLELDNVIPTPVGMVRHLIRRSQTAASSPHARGDGPIFYHP